MNINYVWSGLIVEELVRNGVVFFGIAPGSRSSPLAVAAARHPGVRKIVHFDERGLGFFAMSYASVERKPAALICSSGTAVANFFPAVIEASKKKLPLILLTADRPPELQFTGALQTIDQVKFFGTYVRWHKVLPTPDPGIKPEMVLTTVDQAVFRAKDPMAGPVHLNCMFREPLDPASDGSGFDAGAYLSQVKAWREGGGVYTRYTTGKKQNDFTGDNHLLHTVNNARRGIIVVGKLRGPEECKAVLQLAEKLDWPVFPDIVSGLRMEKHSHIIHYYDQVLISSKLSEKYPVDTVLHLGGRITSKRWYQFIGKQKPANTIMVLSHSLRNDPGHGVTLRVKAGVKEFIDSILPALDWKNQSGSNDFLQLLQNASEAVNKAIDDIVSGMDTVTEIGAAREVSRKLVPGHGLFLGNSMPVREMDMYAAAGNTPVIGGNRGASGIDGIIASGCGFAYALDKPVTLMIGDLSALHDLNSLALPKKINQPLIIVVINNDGGGIFSFLPIAKNPNADDVFDECFGTPHGLEFSKAAQMFGIQYHAPQTMKDFNNTYNTAKSTNTSTIIEIKTNRKENYTQHEKLQENIKTILDNMIK